MDEIGARTRCDVVGGSRARNDQALRCVEDARINALEIGDRNSIANRLVDARRNAQIDAGDTAGRLEKQRVRTSAAVNRNFGAVIGDRILAGPAIDDVAAAHAIDDVGASAAGDRIRRRRTRDRHALRGRQRRRINIFEIADIDRIAGRLVGTGQVHGDSAFQNQGVIACPGIKRRFRSVVEHGVITRPSRNHVCATAAIDRIGSGTGRDGVGDGRADDGNGLRRSERARIDILEVRDRRRIADRLIGLRQIDIGCVLDHERVDTRSAVDETFGAVIGDRIVAGPRCDDVSAAVAIDSIGASARRDRIRDRGADDVHCRRENRGVDILKAGDLNAVTRRLVGSGRYGKIHGRDAARRRKHQRIAARAAINGDFGAAVGDGIRTQACRNDVSAATAIQGIGARAARDGIGSRRARDDYRRDGMRCVDVLEIGDVD